VTELLLHRKDIYLDPLSTIRWFSIVTVGMLLEHIALYPGTKASTVYENPKAMRVWRWGMAMLVPATLFGIVFMIISLFGLSTAEEFTALKRVSYLGLLALSFVGMFFVIQLSALWGKPLGLPQFTWPLPRNNGAPHAS
jgi:hypothetical protein